MEVSFPTKIKIFYMVHRKVHVFYLGINPLRGKYDESHKKLTFELCKKLDLLPVGKSLENGTRELKSVLENYDFVSNYHTSE